MKRATRLSIFPLASITVLCCAYLHQPQSTVREFIEAAIRANIRESWGEEAYQCFTSADLERFRRDHIADEIARQLRSDKDFLYAVESLRSLSEQQRAAYLEMCRQPVHKTWTELGQISRRGQTEAGVEAERIIANKVTDAAESILRAAAHHEHSSA